MIRNHIILSIILTLIMLQSCTPPDPSLTIEIPKEGFTVVQHVLKGDEKRGQNTLYIAPREITNNEFKSPELAIYIDSMYAVMVRTAGVGIASNQLGKSLQIFMIEAKPTNPRYKVLGPVKKQVFINPVITKTSKTRMNFWHGCLSADGENRGNVATYEWIEYRCQNQKGEVRTGRLEGFAAVIFQHEFRHMLGGTYLDHANHFLPKDELDQQLDTGEIPFFAVANDSLPLLIEGYKIGETIEEFHSRNEVGF